jgi:hypothetical protein
MMNIYVNIIPRLVHKVKKDKRSSAHKFFKDILKVHSRLSRITTMANYQITYLFTEME